MADSHSPTLVLALFSRVLAAKQPDWPTQTVVTGFPFSDNEVNAELPSELVAFLDQGPPPIVFTLGTAVSKTPGSFYHHALACARTLHARAVLVVGKGNRGVLEGTPIPPDAIVVEYAAFAKLFPRASVIVHHGGVGTTAMAMRSGRPSLVIPFAWDQFDNGERAARLGIARTLGSNRFTPAQAAAQLRILLNNPAYLRQASKVATHLSTEDGVKAACDALESVLRKLPF